MKIVADCFIAPAYRQVLSDEGSYEAFCGYNVIVNTNEGEGFTGDYIYKQEGDAAYVFDTEAKANALVERVLAAGTIDLTYWLRAGYRHADDLPDYVTDPHRPEFN